MILNQTVSVRGKKTFCIARPSPPFLGQCDAFISHSWSDDGKEKFAAIKKWATDFEKANGRLPTMWLDKACINQADIQSDLLCLPVFLSGCDELLIVAGPTYITRLWCVMEVFVFLTMGGSIGRITIIPINLGSVQEAKSTFKNADVSRSQCHHEAERQKMLAIIEKGFGNFDVFNSIIRHVFSERMAEVSTILDRVTSSRRRSAVYASSD